MNKDALLATLIGFGIGLLITGALLVGPNVFKTIHLPQQNNSPTPTPTPSSFSVKIESPLPDTIENTSDLLVTGTASSGSTVAIAGPLDETVVLVKDDGKFAGKITLTEGKNDITVLSYLGDKQTSQTVTVYFTEEQL
jgi:hypothetical protein